MAFFYRRFLAAVVKLGVGGASRVLWLVVSHRIGISVDPLVDPPQYKI